MKSERIEKWWCGFEWCILNTEKLWSSNKIKKMKSLCNRRVSVWNPDTLKEIVHFVHEVHPVFAVTISTFFTCYVGEMMTPCQLSTFSEFVCSAFQFQGLIAQKISKCMKNSKWSQTGLKIDNVALNGAYWTHKKCRVEISLKKWNAFVTDEFSSETLILRKRLSILR